MRKGSHSFLAIGLTAAATLAACAPQRASAPHPAAYTITPDKIQAVFNPHRPKKPLPIFVNNPPCPDTFKDIDLGAVFDGKHPTADSGTAYGNRDCKFYVFDVETKPFSELPPLFAYMYDFWMTPTLLEDPPYYPAYEDAVNEATPTKELCEKSVLRMETYEVTGTGKLVFKSRVKRMGSWSGNCTLIPAPGSSETAYGPWVSNLTGEHRFRNYGQLRWGDTWFAITVQPHTAR